MRYHFNRGGGISCDTLQVASYAFFYLDLYPYGADMGDNVLRKQRHTITRFNLSSATLLFSTKISFLFVSIIFMKKNDEITRMQVTRIDAT